MLSSFSKTEGNGKILLAFSLRQFEDYMNILVLLINDKIRNILVIVVCS